MSKHKPLRVIDMPPYILYGLGMAMFKGRRRSLVHDQAALVKALQPRPRASGLQNIPRSGPFVLVANHYQNAQLWIGWPGCLLGYAVHQVRPGIDPPVRWMVTNNFTMKMHGKQRAVPFARWAFNAVAHTYDMIVHEFSANRTMHAAALRKIFRLLTNGEPNVVGIFPEGVTGDTRGLCEALPGTGIFLLKVARAQVPIVPCGVWRDESGRLTAHFGAPVELVAMQQSKHDRDAEARFVVMNAIARLVPPDLRGAFASSKLELESNELYNTPRAAGRSDNN